MVDQSKQAQSDVIIQSCGGNRACRLLISCKQRLFVRLNFGTAFTVIDGMPFKMGHVIAQIIEGVIQAGAIEINQYDSAGISDLS